MPQMTVTKARELVGWTQSELARQAGEHVSTIRDLEIGDNTNPSYALVSRVVEALQRGGLKKLQPSDLFAVKPRKSA